MVYFSGFYAWLRELLSLRAQEDARQTDLIQQARIESSKVYSYRKLHDDLLDVGKACYVNLIARLANLVGISVIPPQKMVVLKSRVLRQVKLRRLTKNKSRYSETQIVSVLK